MQKNEQKKDITRLPLERSKSLQDARQLEMQERQQGRLPSWERERILEKESSIADLVLVKKMEEEERRERIREFIGGDVDRSVRKVESKRDLILTRNIYYSTHFHILFIFDKKIQLEEEERNRRIEEMYGEDKWAQNDKKKRLAATKAMEERERQERIKAWNGDVQVTPTN